MWHCLPLFYLAEPLGFLDSWEARSAIKDIILRLGSRPGFTFYLLFLWSWASHEALVDFNFHIRLMELMPTTPVVIVSWLNCSPKVLHSWSFFFLCTWSPWYNRTLHSIHYLFSDIYSVLRSMVSPTPLFLSFLIGKEMKERCRLKFSWGLPAYFNELWSICTFVWAVFYLWKLGYKK